MDKGLRSLGLDQTATAVLNSTETVDSPANLNEQHAMEVDNQVMLLRLQDWDLGTYACVNSAKFPEHLQKGKQEFKSNKVLVTKGWKGNGNLMQNKTGIFPEGLKGIIKITDPNWLIPDLQSWLSKE